MSPTTQTCDKRHFAQRNSVILKIFLLSCRMNFLPLNNCQAMQARFHLASAGRRIHYTKKLRQTTAKPCKLDFGNFVSFFSLRLGAIYKKKRTPCCKQACAAMQARFRKLRFLLLASAGRHILTLKNSA